MSVRVRFAPSPTGSLHIGGVRTALFNYLYAKSQKGTFLLRIEDTDRERSTQAFEDEIIESMRWLGLNWDEEIVHQSRRLDRYREIAYQLVEQNMAYEEVKDGRKAVLFKMPKKEVAFFDVVRGKPTFNTELFDDLVILKSDGFPTYHLAVVVDDYDMQISHVIRGEDHLSNTPRQILLYEALGWKSPKYAHLPLILGDDGTPLSKRHGSVAAQTYRQEGYLPAGLINYLALLGWGDASQDFFDLAGLIKKFSLKKVNKAGAKYDFEKLLWLNGQHIKKMSADEYVACISDYYSELAANRSPQDWQKLVLLYQTRIKKFSDFKTEASYVFEDIAVYDGETLEKLAAQKSLVEVLNRLRSVLSDTPDFSDSALESAVRGFASDEGLEAKDLIHPLRFILTGKTVSPGLFELMHVLGRDVCLKRFERVLTEIGQLA